MDSFDQTNTFAKCRPVHIWQNNSMFSPWKICCKSDVCHGSHLLTKRLGPVQSLIWRSTMYCPQVMEDLLEEWCVSGGHPYDLDVTSLSVALEQARLKYHAQVRSTSGQFKVNLTKLCTNVKFSNTNDLFPFWRQCGRCHWNQHPRHLLSSHQSVKFHNF